MVLLIVLAFLLVCLTVDAVIQYKKRREAAVNGATSFTQEMLDSQRIVIPKGLYFDKTHTWTYMDKYGSVRMGINDFLQHITGPITGVNLKNVGDIVKKGELLLSITQEGKKLNIYSPVSGKIRAYNNELMKDTSLINTSPYSEGWVYDIEPEKWLKEAKLMFMAEKANEWLKNEFVRFKDFIAIIQAGKVEFANVALQDGGEIKDNVLSELGPEVWEEFQTNFIEKV